MLFKKKRFSLSILIGLSLLIPSTSVLASKAERELYIKARTAFEQKQDALADRLTTQLANYPLVPYLQVRQIKRDIETLSTETISAFIKQHRDTPFADDVQTAHLDFLLKSSQSQAYLDAYQRLPLPGEYHQCQLANAELSLGRKKQAFERATQLWQSGNSVDKACDSLFETWMRAGNPSPSFALTRYWNAVEQKNFSLSRYIERFLGPEGKKQASFVNAVIQDPTIIKSDKRLSKTHPKHASLAYMAIRNIARKDINQAAELWLTLRDKLAFSTDQKDQMDHYFGMRYAKGYRSNAQEMLAKLDPDFGYPKLTEWRIRLALSQQDWKATSQLITKLPEALQQEGRWLYWRETAKNRQSSGAYTPDYSQVVKERSFYGFLASEQSATPFYLNHQPAGFSDERKNTLKTLPALQRIRELLALDLEYAARVEWRFLTKQLSKEDQHVVAHIAKDWHWYDQAIWGASRIKAWNDLDIRFPKPHQSLFTEMTKERGIYRTWAVAIARQESAFRETARSRVGARGLMQLMPATAKQTAKKFEVSYSHPDQLYTPKTNISLGTAYLADMLNTFEGNRVYATAAYNAGPGRVKQWLKSRGDLPLDAWIETIPFDETRNYVQNVLAFSVIYDVLDKKPASLFNKTELAALAMTDKPAKKAPAYN